MTYLNTQADISHFEEKNRRPFNLNLGHYETKLKRVVSWLPTEIFQYFIEKSLNLEFFLDLLSNFHDIQFSFFT